MNVKMYTVFSIYFENVHAYIAEWYMVKNGK